MHIEPLEITFGGQTTTERCKRLGLRARAKVFDIVRTAEGSFASNAEFTLKLICGSVVNDENKAKYTESDVDEWPDDRLMAYTKALSAFQSPKLEDVAKNSSTTETSET